MKKLLFAVSEIIRFIPLWIITCLILISTNNLYTKYKSITISKPIELCGTLIEKGNKYGDNYEVSILDNITKTPKIITVNKLTIGSPILCGYEESNANSERSNLGVGIAFMIILSLIAIGIGCSVIADILSGKNYFE